MNLSMISLPMVVRSPKWRYIQTPPLGVAYLAASAREAGHQVDVVDGLGEALQQFHPFILDRYINGLSIEEIVKRVDRQVDVIALSVMFSNHWPLARRVIAALKEAFPSVPIVVGGEHVTATPRHVFESSVVDYAVIGEGEETLVELLNALSDQSSSAIRSINGLACRDDQGGYTCNAPRTRRKNLDSIAWPAWDLIPIRQYIKANHYHDPGNGRVMTMLGTRGCPYRCKFCSNPLMWSTNFYMRSPKDLVDEMEFYMAQYDVTEFQFQDLTFIIKKSWVIEVADEICSRNLDITWKLPSGTRCEAFDAELMAKVSASGCTSLTLAPESGSKRVSEAMNKPIDLQQFLDIAKIARKSKVCITLNAYLIIGIPEETFRDLLKTYGFIVRLAMANYDTVGISKFNCYPGSEYHREFVERGLIVYGDDYFSSLDRSIANLRGEKGMHPRWSQRQIDVFILVGYILFFGVSYTLRPMRILRSIGAVLRNKPVTRLEAVFSFALTERFCKFWRRIFKRRAVAN